MGATGWPRVSSNGFRGGALVCWLEGDAGRSAPTTWVRGESGAAVLGAAMAPTRSDVITVAANVLVYDLMLDPRLLRPVLIGSSLASPASGLRCACARICDHLGGRADPTSATPGIWWVLRSSGRTSRGRDPHRWRVGLSGPPTDRRQQPILGLIRPCEQTLGVTASVEVWAQLSGFHRSSVPAQRWRRTMRDPAGRRKARA